MYLQYILQRVNLLRDIHFYTNTTIDTLDYSGTSLNSGSKVVIAAYGEIIRSLATEVPACLQHLQYFEEPEVVMPGVIALKLTPFETYSTATKEMDILNNLLQSKTGELQTVPVLVICDDAAFVSETIRNFLWVTFTRCNPSHDIYGIESSTINKHWGCKGPLVFDARMKPHHAPPVITDAATEKKIDKLFNKGGSLYSILP